MEVNTIMMPVDAKTLEAIVKDLNEDPKKLERQLCLFKEWLKCEPHLPKNVDERFLYNFVRLCKCDLDKMKTKFEKFLAARVKLKRNCPNTIFDEKYFDKFKVHRQLIPFPKLTPDGYRVTLFRLLPNIETCDLDQISRFMYLLLDIALHEDTFAGQIIIYDAMNFTPQHVAKINIKTFINMIQLVYNVSPIRVKQVHILNMTKIAETLLNLGLKVVSEKVAGRLIIHKNPQNLIKYMPSDVLPKEYGGTEDSLDDLSDSIKDACIKSKHWAKADVLKLQGPIPPHKRILYSFEEYQMEGSFRQLAID